MIDYALCVEETEFTKYKRRIEVMYSDRKLEEGRCEQIFEYKGEETHDK